MRGLTALLIVIVLATAGAPALSVHAVCAGTDPSVAAAPPDTSQPEAVPPSDRVVLYYFHRTARCENCLKFEAYAEEAIIGAFSTELAEGLLEWRVVNLDDSTSAHFVDDYDLTGSSLIVSVVVDGDEIDWRSLDGIWYLVGNKERFIEYVTFEVGEELKKGQEDENAR